MQHFSLPQFFASAQFLLICLIFYTNFISTTPLLRILYSCSTTKAHPHSTTILGEPGLPKSYVLGPTTERKEGKNMPLRSSHASAGSLCPRHGAACYLWFQICSWAVVLVDYYTVDTPNFVSACVHVRALKTLCHDFIATPHRFSVYLSNHVLNNNAFATAGGIDIYSRQICSYLGRRFAKLDSFRSPNERW